MMELTTNTMVLADDWAFFNQMELDFNCNSPLIEVSEIDHLKVTLVLIQEFWIIVGLIELY